MSLIATKPSAARTWSPSLNNRQKRQSSGSENPLLGNGHRAGVYELPNGSVDEPGGVVVPVATARAVDENDALRAELRPPALEAGLVRDSPQPSATLLLDPRRNRAVAPRPGSRTGPARNTIHFPEPRPTAT